MTFSNFVPSTYQQEIFDWIVQGRGDAIVEAVAGSGKTSTLVAASKLLNTRNALFVAFSKRIVQELEQRLAKEMLCKTIHSIGNSILRKHLGKTTIEEDKYRELAKPYAQEIFQGLHSRYKSELTQYLRAKAQDDEEAKEPEEPMSVSLISSELKRLAHFCRVTLTNCSNPAALQSLIERFDFLDPSLPLELVTIPIQFLLRDGEQLAMERRQIDYDDMLWLPYQWNLHPPGQDFVFVDEAQDLSPAQLDLVLKLRSPGGRMIFVGDSRQAIFGFAGASSNSIQEIALAATNAKILPLSICYRCPSAHIKLAQQIVPQIEAQEGAPEGEIEHIKREKIFEVIREGDLVVCRLTAPVIKLCLELIGHKIPARVQGRDVGKQLISIVRDVAKLSNFNFYQFGRFLDEYLVIKEGKLLQQKNSEARIESLKDRVAGVRFCYEAFNCSSVDKFCNEISSLFTDSRGSVDLSTVHRAKGLESERVFILEPDKLPLRRPKQAEWEIEQEWNLKYVALTRAKKSLFFIE